jgi:hypothetical protein
MSNRQRRKGEKRRRHGIGIPSGRRLAAGAGLAIGATFAAGGVAQADDFPVTTLADDATTPPAGSLRQAISAANAHVGADTITFSSALSGTLTLAGNLPVITDAAAISGPGPAEVSVSGAGAYSIFRFDGAFNASVQNLTIRDGHPAANGGGINNHGANLTVGNSIITGNHAAGSGGGIFSDRYLFVASSVVSNNIADAAGGGIESSSGADAQLALSHAIISGNHAGGSGGAIDISGAGEGNIYQATINLNDADAAGGAIETSAGEMFVGFSTFDHNHADGSGGAVDESAGAGVFAGHQVTISDNSAGGSGGALSAASNFFFRQATISNNSASVSGGGIANVGAGGTHGLYNTIVANGTAPVGADLAGAFDAQFSLVENTVGAAVTTTVAGSDVLGQDPQLGPLTNNGGPTQTRALPVTSPAIDQASNAHYTNDQRFLPRAVDLPTIANSTASGGGQFEHADSSDIGAFELQTGPQSGAVATPPSGPQASESSSATSGLSPKKKKHKHKKHKHKHKNQKHKQDR